MDPNNPVNPIQATQQVQSAHKKGPIITGIVVIILLIIAAIYFWGNSLMATPDETPSLNTSPVGTSQAAAVPKSDEVSALESDLNQGVTVDVDLTELDTVK